MPQPSAMLSDMFGALLVRGLGIGLMFASTTIAARTLGAEEYGTFSSALSLAMLLATIAPMGTDRVVSRNLSTIESDTERAGEVAMTLASTLVGMALLAILILPAAVSAGVYGNTEWTRVLTLTCMLFMPLSFLYVRQWIALPLMGTGRALMPEQTLLPGAFSLGLVLCHWFRFRTDAVTTVILYAASMGIVLITATQGRLFGPLLFRAFAQRQEMTHTIIRQRILAGLPFLFISIGAVACQASIPVTLAASVGFHDTACFMLVIPYAALPSLPLGILNLSLLPQLCRRYRNHEISQARHSARSAATFTFCVAGVISTIIWCGSPLIVTILGQDFASAERILPLLLLAAMVDCLTGPTVPVMQSMGLEGFYSRAMLCYLPVQICLMATAGTVSGVQAAAAAFVASRVLWNILVVSYIHRSRGICMLPYVNVIKAFRNPTKEHSDNTVTTTITATALTQSMTMNTSVRAA